MKPLRKNAGGRKSEQHPYHPHPKPSSVQSAVGSCLLLQLLCEGPIWCPSVMCHPVTHWMKWLTMWGLDFLYLFFIPGLQCWSHCTGYPFADGFCQSCQCLYSTAGVYYSISTTLMLPVAILQSSSPSLVYPSAWLQFLPQFLLLYFQDTEVNCILMGNRCDVKLFKSIGWDCILFHLLCCNKFSCVYFVYCRWEQKEVFTVCVYLFCATKRSFFFFS